MRSAGERGREESSKCIEQETKAKETGTCVCVCVFTSLAVPREGLREDGIQEEVAWRPFLVEGFLGENSGGRA